MRLISVDYALLSFWEDLIFLEAALLSVEETKGLAEPVTAHLATFSDLLNADLKSRREAIQARALVSIRDVLLDGGLRALHNGALFLVGQDRKDPRFKALFASPINTVVRFALKRQVEVAQGLLDTLGLPPYAGNLREGHAEALGGLIAQGVAALMQRRGASLGRAEARLEIQGWKEDANALRQAVYGDLLKLAAQSRQEPGWADAFFMPRSPRSGAPISDPEDDPEPLDPTP